MMAIQQEKEEDYIPIYSHRLLRIVWPKVGHHHTTKYLILDPTEDHSL